MEFNPLVSIVIPNYNSERFLERTINSVLDQTYRNWELLVIDDCSTDNGIEIVKRVSEENSNVKLFVMDQNTGGPAGPRNLGFSNVEGEYICLLDSDDVWHPKKLEYQLKLISEKNIVVSSTMRTVFSNDSEINFSDLHYSSEVKKISYEKLLKKNYIVTASVIFKADVVKGIEFNTSKNYVAVEDYDFFLEVLSRGNDLYIQQLPLVYYRITDQNISKNKFKMVKKVKNMLINRKGVIQGNYYFLFYLFLSFVYIYKKR